MKKIFSSIGLSLLLLYACNPKKEQLSNGVFAVIAYVGGYNGIVNADSIDADKLTHINYAFVDVKDSIAWLHNEETDTLNFKALNSLKQKNKDLKILISIGGWSWSENFSDAALTKSSREKFARSAVQIVQKYDLDGVDIDWEYPGLPGEDNVYRTEDKENFTEMLAALRHALDQVAATTSKNYQLTIAVGGSHNCIDHLQMDKAQQFLNYVNIMTYDFFTEDSIAGHHTNLFHPENYDRDPSANKSVQSYLHAGVPAHKLVIGIAFYGRSWVMADSTNHGINQRVKSLAHGGGFTFINDSLVNKKGFMRRWDEKAKAPLLFNKHTNQLVSYDDEESVKHKCSYVKEKGLGGVMFWEYYSDPKEYLLNAIDSHLKK